MHSEFPCYFPIPQHIEMSFLPQSRPNKFVHNAARILTVIFRIYFYCLTPVGKMNTGETPICDFRKVYEEMDPKLRDEFEKKKILNIRSYYSKQTKFAWDPFKSKVKFSDNLFCAAMGRHFWYH